jgi:hypothetical protein
VEELELEQVAVEELELEQADEHGGILGSSAAQRNSACNVEANLNSALPLLGHTTSPFLVPLPPPSPPPHGYTHSTHHLHSLPSATAAHHHTTTAAAITTNTWVPTYTRGYPPHGYTHSTNSTVLLIYSGKVMRPFRISAAMRCLNKDTLFNVHCDLMLCSSQYIKCIACAIKKTPHSLASPH